ncbi:hypothetical protein DEDE109153_03455 [Deinococcus deserti]|uniref:Uncharacterized protein n=1 Tax=Deinococcus deserti (strain DSM 17065 / CIP 109153 / LMG 22923 / VCD115) TaxID=546414 RepID=X5H5N2_DEIDV|nr:hypothetical protein Deide_09148 [Deinococcus deserti VCD115]
MTRPTARQLQLAMATVLLLTLLGGALGRLL